MDYLFIVGVLINTLSFGLMSFTDERMGMSPLDIPVGMMTFKVLYPFIYIFSFFIILASPEGWVTKIGTCILMQIIINHVVWGLFVGTIAGLKARKKLKNLKKETGVKITNW